MIVFRLPMELVDVMGYWITDMGQKGTRGRWADVGRELKDIYERVQKIFDLHEVAFGTTMLGSRCKPIAYACLISIPAKAQLFHP